MKHRIAAATVLLAITATAQASVNEALDALYNSGKSLTSLAADVTVEETSRDLGDKTTRTGELVLQRLPDGASRARLSYLKSKTGKRIKSDRRDYVLQQNGEMIDRDAESKKQFTRRLLQPGEKVDFFKLGDGPFPLPIGQAPQDVLTRFEVAEEKNSDQAVLAVITLTPKPKTPMAENFKWIRVTVDRKTGFPGKIVTLAANGNDKNTVTLTNVRVNEMLKDADFALAPITEPGWQVQSEK